MDKTAEEYFDETLKNKLKKTYVGIVVLLYLIKLFLNVRGISKESR
jgi:hypothetical protein